MPTVEAQQSVGRKLSENILEFELIDDVYLCSDELFEGEKESDQLSCENRTLSKEEEFLEGDSIHTPIGGRLMAHISAWEALNLPEHVLRIIKRGYILPLSTLPKPVILKNNKSALDNQAFVTQAISELLACQSITTVGTPPLVVNPLSVATRNSDEKRLVLDLRHVNPHLHRQKFKCDDVDTALFMLSPGDFLLTFEIKSS